MSDLGPLVPHLTHLIGKWFSFRFSLSFDLESSLWVLKYLFKEIFLFPPQGCHDFPYHGILWMGQSECKVLIRSFIFFSFLLLGYPVLVPRCFLWDSCVMLGQSLHFFFESVRQSSRWLVKRPWCSWQPWQLTNSPIANLVLNYMVVLLFEVSPCSKSFNEFPSSPLFPIHLHHLPLLP